MICSFHWDYPFATLDHLNHRLPVTPLEMQANDWKHSENKNDNAEYAS